MKQCRSLVYVTSEIELFKVLEPPFKVLKRTLHHFQRVETSKHPRNAPRSIHRSSWNESQSSQTLGAPSAASTCAWAS